MESWFAMNLSGEELQTLQAEAGLPTENSCYSTSLDGRLAFGYSTVIPIERAVPAMILAAASMSLALRSSFFVSAISCT